VQLRLWGALEKVPSRHVVHDVELDRAAKDPGQQAQPDDRILGQVLQAVYPMPDAYVPLGQRTGIIRPVGDHAFTMALTSYPVRDLL